MSLNRTLRTKYKVAILAYASSGAVMHRFSKPLPQLATA